MSLAPPYRRCQHGAKCMVTCPGCVGIGFRDPSEKISISAGGEDLGPVSTLFELEAELIAERRATATLKRREQELLEHNNALLERARMAERRRPPGPPESFILGIVGAATYALVVWLLGAMV